MFLQETTPNTSGYMIAGYAVAFIVMSLYVLSLYLRNRNLHQDMEMLEEMDKSVVEADVNLSKPTKQPKSVTKKRPQKQP